MLSINYALTALKHLAIIVSLKELEFGTHKVVSE